MSVKKFLHKACSAVHAALCLLICAVLCAALLLPLTLSSGCSLSGQGGQGSYPPKPIDDGSDSGDGRGYPHIIESAAVDHLDARLAELDQTLYVYRDFADGFNNFTQKAWMGDTDQDIPKMNEAGAGLSGNSGIVAEIDLAQHSWGGYMFLNGWLDAGAVQPSPDFGAHDSGLDLSGAVRLSFYARGAAGGERVQFFVDGMGWNNGIRVAAYPDSADKVSLGTVTLGSDWQEYRIELAGLDLSRIGCGFGWMASREFNPGMPTVRFSLDDIRYEFEQPRPQPMFLQSYASAAPGSDDAIINNFAYLYDNAAAALALSFAGKHQRAQQIADAIVYALDNDRYYTDGRLRNAYSSGDPRSFQGWLSFRAKGFARMPGFYDLSAAAGEGQWFEDYYAVSSATGNLAWAMLALCEVYQNAGADASTYLDAARRIGDFVLTLSDEKGGFYGGYEGWERNEQRVDYKSTEHNIDLIAAYGLLARLSGEQEYADAAAHARAFVLSMYDAERHCFYTGTTTDGVTPSKDVLPLDCNTWAILALGDDFEDAAEVLEFVEQNMRVDGSGSVGGVGGGGVVDGVRGYDFNSDRDGVWFEGTAQVALAYKQIGDDAKYQEILDYLNANSLPDSSITAADRDGVSTGFIVSGTDIPWVYGKRSHVGATAWLAFAQLGCNPFNIL